MLISGLGDPQKIDSQSTPRVILVLLPSLSVTAWS